ncbi:type II toxin-antitoxin system HicB family antitoxin [Pseudomonas sp. TWI628]|uniref:type II toxin-antitoxin system HicB family antitoxin n=1 Tax=Pseudomonas sp. TWI628 TaxID=3136788 RepID=UPI00320B10CA
MTFEYPVIIHRETGSVWISCPDVPEMSSAGDTEEEALFDAVDAMESALSFYVDQKIAIPLPAMRLADQPVVRLPALTAAKAAL